ncbi:MAG: glycosyltransferase [Actinobacteria bacterium]|nr:glycosyltransferase [Actinomycetota bacterium]
MDVSFCIVNTNGGELLTRCLDAIERTTTARLEYEILVLDNASDDDSVERVRRTGARLVALDRRAGKAANDSRLLREARGRYALLLNEDSELLPDAVEALVAALDDDPRAAAAGARLLNAGGVAQPCAWRFTSVATAFAGALWLHRVFTVQSKGNATRRVDWAQSAALLVRTEAANAIGNLDEDFFVYGDEVDFCKRLADAGGHTLYVPAARAYHREGLSHGASARRRIVEFHRGRDLYMRKHHGRMAAMAVRALVCLTYLERAAASTVVRRHSPGRFLIHARAALAPWHSGEGLREAAATYNSALEGSLN